MANQTVQAIALVVAGVWAYFRFVRTEKPAHHQNFSAEQELKWANGPTVSTCYGMLGVTFRNNSASEVEIQRVMRRAWLLPLPTSRGRISFVDPEMLSKAPATDSMSYTVGPFAQRYPPQGNVRQELVWVMQRAAGLAIFRIDLYADSTDSEPSEWIYDWDEVCGGVKSN